MNEDLTDEEFKELCRNWNEEMRLKREEIVGQIHELTRLLLELQKLL